MYQTAMVALVLLRSAESCSDACTSEAECAAWAATQLPTEYYW